MSTTGAIAANFHEGARSEYLAHYAFSAFGTSIPTPRTEDSGVDLYCTLGHRIGQLLHVDNYYFVQVKSEEKEVAFENNKSVEWLVSLISPLLLAFIDKKSSNVRVFATLGVCMLYAKKDIAKVILIPEKFPQEVIEHNDSPLPVAIMKDGTANVFMGEPILDFSVTRLQDADFVVEARAVLKSWIAIDQSNINHKSMGHTFFQLPLDGVTNQVAPAVNDVVGNFLDSECNSEISNRHADSYLKCLTQQLNIAAYMSDCERWNATYEAAIITLDCYPDIRAGATFQSLLGSIYEGGLHLAIPVHRWLQKYVSTLDKYANIKYRDDQQKI